ncbi:MAG: hypothetical protein IT309_08965 [Anaerolineales bacterium]|nr:hypothetical protein [Anaerolineales bacterium]
MKIALAKVVRIFGRLLVLGWVTTKALDRAGAAVNSQEAAEVEESPGEG